VDSVRASIGPALAERYSIEHELGSGAMALVFLAHDIKHDRWVAIKVLKPDVATAIGAERFHREIEVVAGLTHPHILPLYDSGEAAGLLYFVMPYVEGESLRERLQVDGSLSVSEATRIAREMADALEFAHRHGIVHRDVKPANIMLSAGHAQLADFGIAHLIERAEATLTGTGITVGTPAYMSPEQVSGDEALDGRSDVYSLGCVLYESLCGHPPFVDTSRRAVLMHHMVDAPSDIRGECPELPLELVGILRTSLEKDPTERFASAEEMSQALASVRSSIDVTAGARLRRALKRKSRRLKSWQRAGIVGLVVLAAIGSPTLLQEITKPRGTVIAAEDPRATYMVAPFAPRGQSVLEDSVALVAADLLAESLDGFERVDATREHELSGTVYDLSLEGPPYRSLHDALLVARSEGIGTVIGLVVTVEQDTADLEVHQYDTASGDRLGTLQMTSAPVGDLRSLVSPVADRILGLRGEDPFLAMKESSNLQVWQQHDEAISALYDWRLTEAEEGFRRAIALDSAFARAHHYLAVTLFWQTTRDITRRRDVIPEIQAITNEASRLAATADLRPRLEDHIAGLHAFAMGDYETARAHFQNRIEADSTDLEALLFLGVVEATDPWIKEGAEPPVPRGDINLARWAFRETGRRWPQSQISRGLQFDVTQKISASQISPYCPMFIVDTADDLVPPYTDPPDAEWHSLFPTLEGDSIAWVPCVGLFDEAGRAEARARYRQVAKRVYEEGLSEIERWARVSPNHPRPREEWADMILWWHSRQACDTDTAVANGLLREALGHWEAALSYTADTTAQQRITHAVLRMAVRLADPVATAAIVEEAVAGLRATSHGQYEAGSWMAANAFLAAGQPNRALERMRGIWVDDARSALDPTAEEETYYDYGPVHQDLGEIGVLGAVGATGAPLAAAVEAVNRTWTEPARPERARAVLRYSSVRERARSADIRPALALDADMRELWFSEWGDLEEKRAPIWMGMLAADAGSDSGAVWLTEAVEGLDSMYRPFATEYFVSGLLAQRVGEDETAAGLFGRIGSCPLNLTHLDVGWGLTTLSRLYRARSLERLSRLDEAAAEYRAVAQAWVSAEPAVLPLVTEAGDAAARLTSPN